MISDNVRDQACLWAIAQHANTNHKYGKGGLPYSVHLELVGNYLDKYRDLLPDDAEYNLLKICCYTHDLIEDCRITYSTLEDLFGKSVADITYAVTDEKGKNRKERHNKKYWDTLKKTKYADFIKLCDVLANTDYSKRSNDKGKLSMYRKEYPTLKKQLYKEEYAPMFEELEKILADDKRISRRPSKDDN